MYPLNLNISTATSHTGKNVFAKYRNVEKPLNLLCGFIKSLNYCLLRKLNVLRGLIIGGHKLNNMRYTYDSLDTSHRKKTTRTPTKHSDGKQEEISNN